MVRGSLSEVEYLLLLSRDLSFLTAEANKGLQVEVEEIARMLYALRMKVEAGPCTRPSGRHCRLSTVDCRRRLRPTRRSRLSTV